MILSDHVTTQPITGELDHSAKEIWYLLRPNAEGKCNSSAFDK